MAPVLLVAAIRYVRLDIVKEVYDNCIRLPRMAHKDRSSIKFAEAVTID